MVDSWARVGKMYILNSSHSFIWMFFQTEFTAIPLVADARTSQHNTARAQDTNQAQLLQHCSAQHNDAACVGGEAQQQVPGLIPLAQHHDR
jgi:hypothetical protein